MSLSNLATITGYRQPDLPEALLRAWTLSRQVRQLEFIQSEAAAWARTVKRLGASVEEAVREHVALAEQEPVLTCRPAGALERPAGREADEHRELLSAARLFAERCAAGRAANIWTVVDLTEAAIALETLIARHHNGPAGIPELWKRADGNEA